MVPVVPVLSPTGRYTALIEDATLAPSSHNTQPWLFREREGAIELHADRTRALPVNDPHDRELVISCGAALANLCASAEHHHFAPTVTPFPDPDDPDHLATVTLTPTPPYTDRRLAYGIRLRGTWRDAFADRAVPDSVVADMLAAAEQPGVWVRVLDEATRPEVVGLITSGDHFQFSDAHWRRELAAWLHPRRSGDGLVVPPLAGPVNRFVVSHLDISERTARTDAALTETAPLVVVLGTDTEDEPAWLAAGQALERLLLTGAVVGVQGGFSNQPIQVGVLRQQLASLLAAPHPQVLLRMGYPPEAPTATPRRPVEDVLLQA